VREGQGRRAPVAPSTPKGRRTRAQILSAAREVFGTKGYSAARMTDVAETAGLSLGGLYRYFENKTTLFAALVEDVHEELFDASRAVHSDFATHPRAALHEANLGYLTRYHEQRDVMRAFIEAANIDAEFREIWWAMRRRHRQRFAHALRESFGVSEIDGISAELVSDAMACMVEQCAYVWYAHGALQEEPVPVDMAARLVTRAWYRTFFDGLDEPAA
jgi:AcrR family transcriptional regulator